MAYVSLELRGSILSSEIVDKLEDGFAGQTIEDYGLKQGRIGDEIALAWNAVRANWQGLQHRIEQKGGANEIARRQLQDLWVRPLLATLGYSPESTRQTHTYEFSGKRYSVSHVDMDRAMLPIQIVNYGEDLDKKSSRGGHSPQGLVQELLNVSEHLYGLITNGRELRLLRNSSKLTEVSYVSFDLFQMMEDEVYAEFAVLYRLLHASRLPSSLDTPEESIIEDYHQRSIAAGEAIRNRLAGAVEHGLRRIGDAILTGPANTKIRLALLSGELGEKGYLTELLRFVYRMLFLFVIEERDIVYGESLTDEEARLKEIYYDCYSMKRIRRIAETPSLADPDQYDLWTALFDCFRLYESGGKGGALGILPLGGMLFSEDSLPWLRKARVRNSDVMELLKGLARFRNEQGAWTRVNYAALNVEEFGSVYERLLDFKAQIDFGSSADSIFEWAFSLVKGEERQTTSSHYTPDDLVKPLIDHALVPIMEHKIETAKREGGNIEEAILSINVLDSASGSGHFLLSAARRLGLELARIRTEEEQPSAPAMRAAVRDVIRQCVHAVDVNPMAVELCKVALWLESHDPGKPLSFLDHRVRLGNSLIGLETIEQLSEPIPDAAYEAQSDDDKDVSRGLKRRNQDFVKTMDSGGGIQFDAFDHPPTAVYADTADILDLIEKMPDDSVESVCEKAEMWNSLESNELRRLRDLANVWTASFFLPKLMPGGSEVEVATSKDVALLMRQEDNTDSRFIRAADGIAETRGFFHWFVEFPDVMRQGGFDVILGNPPFLGGSKISTNMGDRMLVWLKEFFSSGGRTDICGYFFLRNHHLLKKGAHLGLIATHTISEGATRESSLSKLINEKDGVIRFAIPSMSWPGDASAEVALVVIGKGGDAGSPMLRNKTVTHINSYLRAGVDLGDPLQLRENRDIAFEGMKPYGSGFVLSQEEAMAIIDKDSRNKDVIYPYLNGRDVNSDSGQAPSRWIVNFHDWSINRARQYKAPFEWILEKVYPERQESKNNKFKNEWWLYGRNRPQLVAALSGKQFAIVNSRVTKYLTFPVVSCDFVFSDSLVVITDSSSVMTLNIRSSLHEAWSWKYCSKMKTDLRYTSTRAFRTYPRAKLDYGQAKRIVSQIDEHRSALCLNLGIGLTDVYNLFNDSATDESLLVGLRDAHVAMDEFVLDGYGWSDIDLGHDFREVDYLPEDKNIRFTISPDARREVLKRLLMLNHERAAEE